MKKSNLSFKFCIGSGPKGQVERSSEVAAAEGEASAGLQAARPSISCKWVGTYRQEGSWRGRPAALPAH